MRRVAGILALVVVAAACGRFMACGRKHSPKKEPIARLPTTMVPGSAVASDDVTHYAYLVEDTKGVRVIRDGVPGENFKSATNRSYLRNSHRHVYWARDFTGQPLLIVDDTVIPIGYSKHEYVVSDPKAEHWAAVATLPGEQKGTIILRDGQAIGPFADASVPAWSPTVAGELAYIRIAEEPVVTKHTELVVDGKVVRSHTGNPDTCIPAFGEPQEGPELPRQTLVRFLTDGRLVSLMPDGSHWALRRDDEVLGTFDATAPTAPGSVGPLLLAGTDRCLNGSVIAADSVTAAEQTPVVAWWERPANQSFWRVMIDGKPALSPNCLRPWPHQQPVLPPDGRLAAFPCSVRFDDKGEAVKIIHGLKQYGPYPEVWALALSDDGKHLAYGASDGSMDLAWAVYLDGVQRSERYYAIWRPKFDPSGQHLAWEAMRSPNGPNVLVLDGRTLSTFDDLLKGPIFDRPGEVGWVVRRGKRLARLNFPITP
jgi:hypothetical protein